jgi:TP901 family phage tail tape measure protein
MATESFFLKAIFQFDSRQALESMARTQAAMESMRGGAERISRGIGTVGGSLMKLSVAAAPLTYGMYRSMEAARGFETAVTEVRTIADPTAFSIKTIETSALKLSEAFGTTAAEQAKGLYQAISAGNITASSAVGLLINANKLAVAGLTDTFSAVDVLTTALNAYKGMNLTAADANDVMFTAVKLGKTTMPELASNLGKVIPVASQLRVPFEQLAAGLATCTMQGVDTTMATTGLNAALSNVLNPTKEASDTAKKLGVDFSVTALKSKGLAGFLGEIIPKVYGNEAASAALFGSTRALRAIMAITTNSGEMFNYMLEGMKERSGAAEEAFMKMAGTMAFKMRQLVAQKEGIEILFGQVLGENLMKIAEPLGGVAAEMVKIMMAVKSGDFGELNETSQAVAIGISGAFETVRGMVLGFIESMSRAKSWIVETFGSDAIGNIVKFGVVIGLAAAALLPVIVSLGVVGFLVSGLFGLFTGLWTIISGIGAVIAGMTWPMWALVAVVLIFKDQLWAVFEGLGAVVGYVFDDILNTIVACGAALSAAFGGSAEESTETWKNVGMFIGAMISTLVTGVIELGTYGIMAAKSILDAFGMLATGLKWIFATISDVITAPIRLFMAGVIALFDMAGKGAMVPALVRSMSKGFLPGMLENKAPIAKAPGARGLAEQVAARGAVVSEKETKAGENFLETLKELGALTADSSRSSAAAAKSAEAAANAANKAAGKPTNVNVDGREVARANAKHQEEIKVRSGFETTPWQRRLAVEHGVTAWVNFS